MKDEGSRELETRSTQPQAKLKPTTCGAGGTSNWQQFTRLELIFSQSRSPARRTLRVPMRGTLTPCTILGPARPC